MSSHGKDPKVNVKEKGRYYTRSAAKEKFLKMYNSNGNLSSELPDARIAPDRKWFGNTRTITQDELSEFQNAYREVKTDPFQVVLHRRKLPTSLVEDRDDAKKYNILKTESYETTFGKKSQRLRPNLQAFDLKTLMQEADKSQSEFISTKQQQQKDPEESSSAPSVEMGQTKRVIGEVYKVIDSSDVVVQVLDARDPLGTRSRKIEEFMVKEAPHKHMIFLINKCDLVPRWVTEKSVRRLSRERPTLAFRSSLTLPFGKDQLEGLLKQFQRLHSERSHLSVGFIGYPNVGKSSVVNTLKKDKVCPVAPIPGQTKVWQFIAMTKKIYLIDCPGHVYPDDVTDVERVMRGVTRVERIKEPEHYVSYITERVRPEYLKRAYQLKDWKTPEEFLDNLARRLGRLGKGGKPDTHTAAIRLITDFQRGSLPWFVLVHSRGEVLPPQKAPKYSQDDFSKLNSTIEFGEADKVAPKDEAEEELETVLDKEAEAVREEYEPLVDEEGTIVCGIDGNCGVPSTKDNLGTLGTDKVDADAV